MSNKRLNKTIEKAFNTYYSRCCGWRFLWLDAYNNRVYDEVSPTIKTTIQTSCMNFIMEKEETKEKCITEPTGGFAKMGVLETQNNLPFRVRRLTERELFRLMDVSEDDIDKIQNAGISKTQQAKMAGNSIVVGVLYAIFHKMFINTDIEKKQLELF